MESNKIELYLLSFILEHMGPGACSLVDWAVPHISNIQQQRNDPTSG